MSDLTSRRQLLMYVLAPAALAPLVGCAAVSAETGRQELIQRAKDYWEHMRANDRLSAWKYEAASKDKSLTLRATSSVVELCMSRWTFAASFAWKAMRPSWMSNCATQCLPCGSKGRMPQCVIAGSVWMASGFMSFRAILCLVRQHSAVVLEPHS